MRLLLDNGDDIEENTTHLQKKEDCLVEAQVIFPYSVQDLWGIPNLRKGFNASGKSLNQTQTDNSNIWHLFIYLYLAILT